MQVPRALHILRRQLARGKRKKVFQELLQVHHFLASLLTPAVIAAECCVSAIVDTSAGESQQRCQAPGGDGSGSKRGAAPGVGAHEGVARREDDAI
jgi:hypothetical protein